ncbi:hypothetical protein LJC46_09620 [Desulfovibrio sp. OttesenSCG-928-G15]|nr:hypothetical protein [Desulfovibrio sp. OttesenSCG-928-G15]
MGMYEVERICMYCRYWRGDTSSRVYAYIGGELVWVGQCMNEESSCAPCACTPGGAELAVFSQPVDVCPAFALPREVEDELADLDATCKRLCADLVRQVWS